MGRTSAAPSPVAMAHAGKATFADRVSWLARCDALPADVEAKARLLLLDTLGCLIAGLRHAEVCQFGHALVSAFPGTIAWPGSDIRLSPAGAAGGVGVGTPARLGPRPRFPQPRLEQAALRRRGRRGSHEEFRPRPADRVRHARPVQTEPSRRECAAPHACHTMRPPRGRVPVWPSTARGRDRGQALHAHPRPRRPEALGRLRD